MKRRLTIEQKQGIFWGRTTEEDNLIVDFANSQEKLIRKISALIKEYSNEIGNIEFSVEYDLRSFFEEFSYLKISKLSELSGINDSLMRQYATGQKFPSIKQLIKIQKAIDLISKELSMVKLTK